MVAIFHKLEVCAIFPAYESFTTKNHNRRHRHFSNDCYVISDWIVHLSYINCNIFEILFQNKCWS